MRIHKKIGTKERLFEMFENVNKLKINEAFDSNKTLSVKDWNDFSDGSIELTFSDNRIESFNYYDEEDNDTLDYHVSAQEGDNVGVLLYINDDNTLMAKVEATSLTHNPDNPEWEINNILEVEPFQQQTNEYYDESYVDPLSAARTSGEQTRKNDDFIRLSANNFQPFKDEYGIPDDIFNRMSDDEKRKELVDYLSIEESVNEMDYHQREDMESEPDKNSTYTLKDNNFERLQIDSVSKANNHENVNNGWKFIERKPSNNGSYSYHWRNTGNPDVQWTFGKQKVEKVVPMHQDSMIKEDVNNEVGTDSGIFQMLLAYVTKNRITEEEFKVGELTVQIIANPTTWDESPYMAATRMQPEEGGYPENVQGEISDIVIWDREDNEYTLSSDALQRLNQNISFDGQVLEDITQKAANGSEDEYSRADFARKDNLENEGISETSYTDLAKTTDAVDMMKGIRFNYDQKGNWIPEGYEDKRIALRPLEQPLGSDNWKVALVTLDVNGELDDIVKVTDTWEEGKNVLHASIT